MGSDPSVNDPWVQRNPLRKWREKTGSSYYDTARALGCTLPAVQAWEKGRHMPSEENMVRIERLVGRGTRRRWMVWYSEKPGEREKVGGHRRGGTKVRPPA